MPALVIFTLAGSSYWGYHDPLTWERAAVYLAGFLSLLLGIEALIGIMREALRAGRFPTFLLLTFIYQKVCLAGVYLAAFAITANEYIPLIPFFPEWLVYGTLIAAVVSNSVVNITLKLGRNRGWLDVEVDPVPLRSILEPGKT